MSDAILQGQIEAAKAYEALFVAALFAQWASKVVQSIGVRPGHKVLDVACGTGVLAREALAVTGGAGYVAGLDPNPGMLAVARELEPGVDWRQGVAEAIPFPSESFDVVVSQFGLMFFEDRELALREMLRALVPGGHLGVAVWDQLTNVPAYAAEVALLERLAGPPAANAIRAPFVLGDRAHLAQLFRDAGAGAVKVTTHEGAARFPSIRVMIEADLRGWLPVVGVVLAERQIADIVSEAETLLGEYVGTDGQVRFAMPAHLVTATKT
jgi:SAM-dependent methyltransferase